MGSGSVDPGRAHTDFLTGSLHLLDLPTNALFNYLRRNRLPPVFLPSFLHEATHFWCESTYLGIALALLEMRAHRELLTETHTKNRLIHDIGVVDSVHKLLRPLFEGMALFAEFDAGPGQGSIFANPGLWAGAIFTPLDEPPPTPDQLAKPAEWMTGKIISALTDYRAGETALRRKIDTLMQPLSGDPNFYLCGYLCVKQLWHNAGHCTKLLSDRDLFLCFLREWIFQDWKLINYVLDESLSPPVAFYFISQRFQERLVELGTADLSHEVREFDRLVASNSDDFSAITRCLRLKEEDLQPALSRHNALIKELYDGLGKETNQEDISNLFFCDVMTLEHRQKMMRLALERVEIEVNEHKRVQVRRDSSIEGTYLSGKAPEDAKKGTTPGSITAYYLPDFKQMILLALREGQPVLWLPAEDIPEDEFLKLRVAITKVIDTEKARRGIRTLCREQVRAYHDADYENVIDGMDEFVERVYQNYALASADEGRVPKLVALLSKRGFYDLLEQDGDLLTALALIGLFPAIDNEIKVLVKAELERNEIDLASALSRLREIGERNGFRLIVGEETILCKF